MNESFFNAPASNFAIVARIVRKFKRAFYTNMCLHRHFAGFSRLILLLTRRVVR